VSRRNTELLLLAVVGVAATIAYASVYAARFHDLRRDSIVTGVIFLVLFLVIHLTERRYLPQGDPYLVPLAALLSAIGLTEIYRISPALALKQGEWLLIGVALFVATVLVVRDVGRLAAYRYLIGAVGLVLLALTVVAGTSVNGSRLWIRVAGFSIQPSEFAKIAIVIFLAGYLNQNKEMLSVPTARLLGVPVPPLKYFGPLLVMWVLSLVMLVFM
jgi:peptidoglycan glycosyltransferase